jgi:hypothetical protein
LSIIFTFIIAFTTATITKQQGVSMKFSDVMIQFNYNMASIARAVDVSKQWVLRWKQANAVPIEYQCLLEVITDGALKADRDLLPSPKPKHL